MELNVSGFDVICGVKTGMYAAQHSVVRNKAANL